MVTREDRGPIYIFQNSHKFFPDFCYSLGKLIGTDVLEFSILREK